MGRIVTNDRDQAKSTGRASQHSLAKLLTLHTILAKNSAQILIFDGFQSSSPLPMIVYLSVLKLQEMGQ